MAGTGPTCNEGGTTTVCQLWPPSWVMARRPFTWALPTATGSVSNARREIRAPDSQQYALVGHDSPRTTDVGNPTAGTWVQVVPESVVATRSLAVGPPPPATVATQSEPSLQVTEPNVPTSDGTAAPTQVDPPSAL